jgi:predicted phosphoribosyltransferase
LDLVVPRKIGSEFNKEYAIGAITETGARQFGTRASGERQIKNI